jgi:tRNA dimethylallyltransferase
MMDLTLNHISNGLVTGFREFHQYLTDPSPSEKKYQAALENMKISNRQYAKRQISWIRNKLLPAVRAAKTAEVTKCVELYLLDATGRHHV